MRSIAGILFALVLPCALAADDAHQVSKELQALRGTWKAVSIEAKGNLLPKERVPDFKFIIADEGKATSKSPYGDYQATITVDPGKSPKTLDNLHVTGAQKGKKQYGIYQLDGDTWTVCMTPPGVAEASRPQDFSSKNNANAVFVFKRLKKDEKELNADRDETTPKGAQ